MVSPTKNDNGTIRSHLVWRHYLKTFTKDGNIIFVKNKKTGKIIGTSTENTAVSKNKYTIEKKISESEVQLFKQLVKGQRELKEDEEINIDSLVAFLNCGLDDLMHPPFSDIIDLSNFDVDSSVPEAARKRTQEELFTYYEHNFIDLYSQLLTKNASFYNGLLKDPKAMDIDFGAGSFLKMNAFYRKKAFDLLCRVINERGIEYDTTSLEKKIKFMQELDDILIKSDYPTLNETKYASFNFLTFFISQAFRTDKVLSKLHSIENHLSKSLQEKYKGKYNQKNIAALNIHCQIRPVGLFLIRKKHKIVFIENNSEVEFITSDSPVININGLFKKATEMTEDELEYYYPLSPRLAMLLTSRECYSETNEFSVSADEAIRFNELIYTMAERFVYSAKKENLM